MTTVIRLTPASPLPDLPGRRIWISGIYTEERAKCWGAKNGYEVVWWNKRAGRVYAIQGEKK